MSDFSPEIQLDKQIKTDEHVRHVTIRQIIGAERKHDSAPWNIECREVSALMIVANILNCSKNQDGCLDFDLDDGTGRIKCSMGSQKSAESSFDHFAYVRVVGTISQSRSRDKKYFKATGLAEVIDPHEIYYHSIKAIEHSLLVQKLIEQSKNKTEYTNALDLENVQEAPSVGDDTTHSREREDTSYHESINDSDSRTLMQETVDDFHRCQQPPSVTRRYDELERHGDGWPSGPQMRTVSSSSTASYHTACSRRSASPEVQSGHDRDQDISLLETPTNISCFPRQRSRTRIRDPYEHLTIFQRDIILCISNAVEDMDMYTRPNGVHIRDIVRGLRTKYAARLNEREIGEAIEYLLDQGYIYTSIDDSHYAITP